MKNPYKIIHKFKNNNGRIQYFIYIFIGPLIDDELLKVLESFRKKDFFSTITTINKKNLRIVENFYGEKWYKNFFTIEHISYSINKITSSKSMKSQVISNLGKDWYDNNIDIKLEDIREKKIPFSFSTNYQNYLISRNKIKNLNIKKTESFKTYKNDDVIQYGGDDDDELDVIEDEIKKEENEEDDKIENIEDFEDEVIDDFNLDELMKLYSVSEQDTSKEIKETSKLISNAINDKNWEKKMDKLESTYDDELDNSNYDLVFEKISNKHYITSQYIFEDDTVHTMRLKIANSIPLNPKFGKDLKMLPEYQYFWSEYIVNKKLDKVMIGQKWIRRNELLQIDIEPNENLKVYENLRDNLNLLRDSFGYKIKREDDEQEILRDYDDYITNNEIFMIDILNELGTNYNVDGEKLKNLYDVFITIYFPLINYDRMEQVIQLLNYKNNKEEEFNTNSYLSISNDMKIEKEIYETIEKSKMTMDDDKKYQELFFPTHVIQSIIHVNILDAKNITGTISQTKFNLYRIFDNFIVDDMYPFMQFNSQDGQVKYKYYTKSEVMSDQELLTKWFENAPYGINFKIKLTENKYISINFMETGRIEYKITWKEDDKATIEDIKKSYTYVRDLIGKINNENKKIKIVPPSDERFKYAFINTIQKFNLPGNFKINHNDLSEFSRLFYPYISLVIEPKKRVSKKGVENNKTSKYGTYLRYKRISKYENTTRMHLRILYFLRNYDLSDRELIDEIAKQFNITSESAAKELDYVKSKYSKVIKKSKKVLKKLKSMPKSKPPGIGIDIQGRERDRYKIRITGARNKNQLKEIVEFMKILIFLYCETYLYKKPKYEKLKGQLTKLNRVAKRRNKVIEIVDYETPIKNVKSLLSLDKSRLSYRPEEGQNQYSRNCQNSGEDKKRRPHLIIDEDNIAELLKEGFRLNKESGLYEKEAEIKVKGKIQKVNLKAVKLFSEDTGKYVYYACTPEGNKKHTFIGFLSRGNNPSNLCAPCCFKKDQSLADNKKKRNYFQKCIGNKDADDKVEKISNEDLGDKIYILQDTNKIQEGRFINLPKYLDFFFNKLWKNENTIKNHYLIESKTGYYFKYTVKDETYHFLAAIANVFSTTVNQIKEKLVTFIKNDNDDKYFNFLNSGMIRETFVTRENFIKYIKESKYLEYDTVGELISIPGVLDSKGIFMFILEKRTKIIKRTLEKDTIVSNYYIDCLNSENYYLINQDRLGLILLKEGRYYFPVYNLKKDSKVDKKIILTKKFNIQDKNEFYQELINYFNKSCINNIINEINKSSIFNSKNIELILIEKEIPIKVQLIDTKNKVRFIKLKDNTLIPVNPGGSLYEFPIERYSEKDIQLTLEETINRFKAIEKKLNMDFIPSLVYFDKIEKNDKLNIVSMRFKNKLTIPVKSIKLSKKEITKLKLDYQRKTRENEIDEMIIKEDTGLDNISYQVKLEKFINESYNLFRLELSLFLEKDKETREQIINLVRDKNIKKSDKKNQLRNILFRNLSKKISKYKKSKYNDIIEVVDKIPNLESYNIKNLRDYCVSNKTKEKCNVNHHCLWVSNTCKLQLKYDQLIEYINRVIEEMILNNIQFKELIQESNYFVSDIVDYNLYTTREDQKILKTSNFNIKNIMADLFGKDNIPIIGKKRLSKRESMDIEEDFPDIEIVGDIVKQPIIKNKDSVIRAYANCLYWINNKLYDIDSRNLGFVSDLQTQITYLLKAKIIDFIQSNKDNDKISKDIREYFKEKEDFFESAINKFRKTTVNTNGFFELLILSYIFPKYPIVVFNNFQDVIYIFNNGSKNNSKENIEKYSNQLDTIKIQFDFENQSEIPNNIYSVFVNN